MNEPERSQAGLTAVCAQCEAPTTADATRCDACGDDPCLTGRNGADRADERYALLEVLGRGAAGVTWRGRRLSDGLDVAIKELNVGRVDSLKALELFEREARVLASLDHPAIPRHIDDLFVEQGRRVAMYLVQEFVDGPTLEAEMARRRHDERDVLAILAELLEAVDHLHRLRPPIVHRDIKPANIMRRPDGRLVLIDFGAVREVVRAPSEGGSTTAGTFGYMAPEQFAGVATPATDIYALGVTAVRLLSRREPHELAGSDGRLRWEEALGGVTPDTRRLLARMLAPDPTERASSAHTLGKQVRRLLAGQKLPAPTSPAPQHATGALARITSRRLAIPALLAGVAALGGLARFGPAVFGVAFGLLRVACLLAGLAAVASGALRLHAAIKRSAARQRSRGAKPRDRRRSGD